MTSCKKVLPVTRFLLTLKNVDTDEHMNTIMSPVGFKPTILIRTLLS